MKQACNTFIAQPLDNKRERGQFYTAVNAFNHDAFHRWLKGIQGFPDLKVVEPFAGANNIVQMLDDLGYGLLKWEAFDVAPEAQGENSTRIAVEQRDTLENYPEGFQVAITNPPYLAKNSAVRRGISFPETAYEDLYQLALEQMLSHTAYVAAIVPESFLTQGRFFSRLRVFISLPFKMFEDTETPVCLVLFGPEEHDDFAVWTGGSYLGTYRSLEQYLPKSSCPDSRWVFNDPNGFIFLQAIDSSSGPSIGFCCASRAKAVVVKESSRSQTLIGWKGKQVLTAKETELVVARANALIAIHRRETQDSFLTAFKGLRKDGQFRRRLDFKTARCFLDQALSDLGLSARSCDA